MEVIHDYIVIGSGACGIQAAQTLIEDQHRVLMIDVGEKPSEFYSDKIPKNDFVEIRRSDPYQHQYFLGQQLEYLSLNSLGTGVQLTPPRLFVTRESEKLTPFSSNHFKPMISLAEGGLGGGWGGGCYVFSDGELQKMGLDPATMKDCYSVIAKRIGISAEQDGEAENAMGGLKDILPPIALDRESEAIYSRYKKKKKRFQNSGFSMGRTPLAVLSQPYAGRPAYEYRDMDFWDNSDESAYRPRITLKKLKESARFTYLSEKLALSFEESPDKIRLDIIDVKTHHKQSVYCRKLLLAAGAINSGRLTLRSLGRPHEKMPLLCNPYVYIPCLNYRAFNSVPESKKSGFSQLSMYYDDGFKNENISVGSFYTYRSLLLYKLIKEIPINIREARRIAQALQSSLVIVGLFVVTSQDKEKFMTIEKDDSSLTGEHMKGDLKLSVDEERYVKSVVSKFKNSLWGLGLIPLKNVDPGLGGSIHYGGTIPFKNPVGTMECRDDGRIRGFKNVYVADGSSFTFLPGKGLTFTLMANAHRVAKNASS